jgi:hypothetical protein
VGEKGCPWCGQELVIETSEEDSPYGRMHLQRCARCRNIVRVRLDGEPEVIVKKGLVEPLKEGESLRWVEKLVSSSQKEATR